MTQAHGVTAAELAKSLKPDIVPLRAFWGIVQAVEIGSPSTLQITLGASSVIVAGVAFFSGYLNPTPGDKVLVLDLGHGDLFVLGDPFTTIGNSTGPAGISWPLQYSGDMCFQPDGFTDSVLCLKSTGGDGSLTITGEAAEYVRLDAENMDIEPVVDIDLNPGRDYNSIVGRDENINTGRDFNLEAAEDVNVSATRSCNLSGTASAFLGAPEIVFYGATALPTPGDVQASQFALWLDDTPGATKLMIYAKDSGGTAVTGSVTLT